MLQFIFISGSDFIFNFQSEANPYISAMVLQQIRRAKDMGKMTCQMMTSMFTTKEMSTCLVTGKRLKLEDRDRPVLDQEKVSYIIGRVLVYGILKHCQKRHSSILCFSTDKCISNNIHINYGTLLLEVLLHFVDRKNMFHFVEFIRNTRVSRTTIKLNAKVL